MFLLVYAEYSVNFAKFNVNSTTKNYQYAGIDSLQSFSLD